MVKVTGHASPTATLVVIFTSTALAIVIVALRLWTRLGIVRRAGWDDLLVAIALMEACIFTTCVALEVHFGLGRHLKTITPDELTGLLISLWVSVWNYYIGLGLAKLSIVIQCFRIFGHIRAFAIASYILASIIIAFTIFATLTSIFMCRPVPHFWHPMEEGGYCLPRLPLWFFNSAFTMVTDIAITVLPMPVIKSLHMTKRQKIILMLVFGLGGLICVVSVIRFYGIYAISVSHDDSWENPQAALYSNVELTVGIIASCLPTLKGLVERYFPRLFKSSSSMGSSGFGGIPSADTGEVRSAWTTRKKEADVQIEMAHLTSGKGDGLPHIVVEAHDSKENLVSQGQ